MEFGIDIVKKFLPHRDPFLFVDAVESIKFSKKVSQKEKLDVKDITDSVVMAHYRTKKEHPIFKGHFPGAPILPGVIQIEMMAQASSFSLIKVVDWENLKMEVMLLSVMASKFRKPIYPEMDLKIEATCAKIRGPFMTNNCVIYHGDEVMSEASVLASVKFV